MMTGVVVVLVLLLVVPAAGGVEAATHGKYTRLAQRAPVVVACVEPLVDSL